MIVDLPAHVLRLEHAPVAAAVARLRNYATTDFRHQADVAKQEAPSRARVILGLDTCRLCNGTRRSPETDLPCEVCTVVGGSWYPVVP